MVRNHRARFSHERISVASTNGDSLLIAKISPLTENGADYSGFESYLNKERKAKTVRRSLSLAKQYGHVLVAGDAVIYPPKKSMTVKLEVELEG